MIPKIIHQIWIQGEEKIPKDLRAYWEGCKEINGDFEHVFWDEDRIRRFLRENYGKDYVDLYDRYKVPAQKADFARYAILYVWGGVYLDMDMVCRKNLEPFLKHRFFHTGYILADFFQKYLNGIIGCVPRHEVFPFIFKNVFARQSHLSNIVYSTGTSLFYDSIKEYERSTGNHDIVLIHRKYLHPCNIIKDDIRCPYTCTDCYVAHTGYNSWSPTNRLVKSISNLKVPLLILFLLILLLILVLFS